MTKEATRLYMRRKSAVDGNKFVIRLDPEVDRNADLYSLFREGIVIEVMKISCSENGEKDQVTFGVEADRAFKVDRVEHVTTPRTDEEIGREKTIEIRSLSKTELDALDSHGLNERLSNLRDAEAALRHQQTRLKRDKSLAGEAGYRFRQNDNYHRWVMLLEELDIVTEQLERARLALQQVIDHKKAHAHALRQARSEEYPSIFVRLAKEKMSASAFEKLSAKAEELAAKAIEAA